MDAQGQSGGIWIFWKNEVGSVSVLKATSQYVHITIDQAQRHLNMVIVYAAPSANRRRGLWNELRILLAGVTGPTFIGGDFNCILNMDERIGGTGSLSQDSNAFSKWISDTNLVDMGFRGNKFTWQKGRTKTTYMAKRLDRILCCTQARISWQNARVRHLPFMSSDHSPLYLELQPAVRRDPTRRPFRFEAAWLQHPNFKEMVETSWDQRLPTTQALKNLTVHLKAWNRNTFQHIEKRKKNLSAKLEAVRTEMELDLTDELILEEAELNNQLDQVLEQEEIMWFQKSREAWLAHGDRNTNFFHTSTIIRRAHNKIEMLKGPNGNWISDDYELEEMAVDFYRNLYSMGDVPAYALPLPSGGFPDLSVMERRRLETPFSAEEVEEAVRGMSGFKAPGPDGFQPIFYQRCWNLVGPSVTRLILDFYQTGILPEGLNDALMVLIPKIPKPDCLAQFRPISLCNVLFKFITKTLANRLKGVISKLIGPTQSSFIPGRLSSDNIVIVQEAVHSMRRKKGKRGWMLLKLDLEKAYDRIRWDFLEDTLNSVGLSSQWITWIMTCVRNPNMTVLWNGEKTRAFKAERGLRQGSCSVH